MYKYLISLLVLSIIPGIYFFIRFREKRKQMAITILLLFVVFIAWEFFALHYSLWSWNGAEIIGRLFGLPIDEYLYIFFVPLMGLGLYELVGHLTQK